MYIHKTEKQLKEVDVTLESYFKCDKCNDKIERASYDAFEFFLRRSTGNSYPEGGFGENEEMHLCLQCSYECLELLKENGYRINESDWET